MRLKVLLSKLTDHATVAVPGTLIDNELAVACGDGRSVRLQRLQRPGGKPLNAREDHPVVRFVRAKGIDLNQEMALVKGERVTPVRKAVMPASTSNSPERVASEMSVST